jgi:TolB-like protein
MLAYVATLVVLLTFARLLSPDAGLLTRPWAPVVIVAGLVAAALAAWFAAVPAAVARPVEPVAGRREAGPPLTDAARASIAVLPLEALSRGDEDEVLARGFSAEIIRALSGVPDLRVVPEVQSALYAGRRIQDVAQELDVRYLLSGSLQRTADRLRVIVTLTDAGTSQQVWSESYEKPVDDLFQVQREVAEAVAIETGSRFLNIISEDLCRQAPQGLSAWCLTHKALTFWTMSYTPQSSLEAIGWLEQAIRLEPSNAMAHALLGFVLNQRVVNSYSDDAQGENTRALAEIEAAMRLAPRDATVMEYAALVWLNCGFRAKSLQTARRVVSMTPFNLIAWGYVGCDLVWGGRPEEIEEGLGVLRHLLESAPNHPSVPFWHFFLACGCVEKGDFAAARGHLETAIGFHPAFCLGWVTLANVLGELGDVDGAREAVSSALAANPLFRLEGHQRYLHAISQETPQTPFKQTAGLVKAGLLPPWNPEAAHRG